MQKKTILILVLALAVLMAGASVLYKQLGADATPDISDNGSQGETTEEEKYLMPDFTVYDADGNAVNLSDFRGMPVVLNFWASWCGPCQSEMPDFDAMAAKYDGEVSFLMINLTDGYQETVDTAAAFIRSQGYSFPVYYDADQDAATVYGVTSVPRTYFIDAEGYGITQAMGAIGADELQTGIDMILK